MLLLLSTSVEAFNLAAKPLLPRASVPAAVRLANVRLDGLTPTGESLLDTTEKFDEIAAGAALVGSCGSPVRRIAVLRKLEFCDAFIPPGASLRNSGR